MRTSRQGSSNTRPPKSKVPRFDETPRNWSNFIAACKTHVHDVCANDQERLAHLKSHLVPLLANSIGSALNVPGLYQTALRELQRDYGNPRAIAASCSAELLKIQPFKDEDPQGLRRFTQPSRYRQHAGTRRLRRRSTRELFAPRARRQTAHHRLR